MCGENSACSPFKCNLAHTYVLLVIIPQCLQVKTECLLKCFN